MNWKRRESRKRTSEERISELHRRMTAMEKNRNRNRYRIISTAVCAACLAVTVIMAVVIAQLPVQAVSPGIGGASASSFVDHTVLGYIVVALIAFCLGALVTVLSFRMKKHAEEKEKDARTL